MSRHLFEVYYQEKFLNDTKNFYKQHPHKYPIYSLEGRLKWDIKKEKYINPETQKVWEWWELGHTSGKIQ